MRRKNDFYPTPEFATRELLRHVEICGAVLECCAGAGDIARPLAGYGRTIYTNDIDRERDVNHYFDATRPYSWPNHKCDWVVTNPPFSVAAEIVPLAYQYAVTGIAMLLRLSYLEPVENRGAWLNDHPPTTLIVLPRISFTGDGKTDNVTCAWMVWQKPAQGQRIIVAENPRFATAQQNVFQTVNEEKLDAVSA